MPEFTLRHQLIQLISAHFKEIIREPGVIFWGIVFPILMALGLGVAFTKKTDIVRNVAIINRKGINSDSLWKQLENSADISSLQWQKQAGQLKLTIFNKELGNSTFIFVPASWNQAMIMLKRGNISMILEEKSNKYIYHFDPLNPEAQLNYMKLSRVLNPMEAKPLENPGSIAPLTVTGTRYIDFLVPGLIAMGIMMSSLWGISYGIIDKRTKKLLRRMIATPMRKSNLLLSIITVRFGMNFIESALLFIFAFFFFHIRVQGDIIALALVFLAGNIAFSGISIFISSRTANTEVGNGLINAVVLPMMVLSGIFFSYHNFPKWSIPIIQKLPLTMLADSIRSIFNEGAGIAEVIIPTIVLTIIGFVFFVTGLRIFRWY
jgi:ABC-2 type transport system permease protein